MTDRPPYRVAVIVTVYNEALLLPICVTYYGRAFGLSNLFVLDDGSTDGSTDNLGDVNVIKLDEPAIDQKRRAVNVAYFHRHLLKHYQAAIYVDVDEFLVVDPLLKVDIRTYIEQTSVEHFNALGLNVIHDTVSEPGIHSRRAALCTAPLRSVRTAVQQAVDPQETGDLVRRISRDEPAHGAGAGAVPLPHAGI